MEIEITSLLEMDCFALSHSRAEGGDTACRDTWNASLEQAEETPLLDSPEKLDAMRDFARSSGGWGSEEIATWDAQKVNALFLQWIAGDVRQLPAKLGVEITERDGEWWRDDEDGESEWGPYESRSDAYRDAHGNRIQTADSLDEIDWEEAEISPRDGSAPENLFRSDDGRIFFYLGF